MSKIAHAKEMAARLLRRSWRSPIFRQWGKWTGEQLRKMRAVNGVGRPPRRVYLEVLPQTYGTTPAAAALIERLELDKQPSTAQEYARAYEAAVEEFGSQRAAAHQLGISLGRLQRVIRKARA